MNQSNIKIDENLDFPDFISSLKDQIYKKSNIKELKCQFCNDMDARYIKDYEFPVCLYHSNLIERKNKSSDQRVNPEKFLKYCGIFGKPQLYEFSFYKNEFKYLKELKEYPKKNQLYDIFLCGNPGNGKTGISVCIIKELLRRGCKYNKMFYITEDNLKDNLISKQQDRHDYEYLINQFCNYSLLIIDDLGYHKPSDFIISVIKKIIDKRQEDIENNKNTIIITNLDKNKITDLYGHAFLSRINTFEKMIIESRDYRSGK